MLVQLPDLGQPMREDESPCRCFGYRNESLAYNWRLGRAMVLGSLQCLGVLLFWVLVWQGPAVLPFFSHLSCLPFSFPFLRGHGLAWLQCCRLGRWLGCKTPKQTYKWTEEQTNKLSYSLKSMHWNKSLYIWWDDLFFFMGAGEIFTGEGSGGRGGGKRG